MTKACFCTRIQALVPQLSKILICRCYVEVWYVLSVTEVQSIHWSQNKVSGNSLPIFRKPPCNFSNPVSIFCFQIFIHYTKLLTSMTNTVKVTTQSLFPMLAAILSGKYCYLKSSPLFQTSFWFSKFRFCCLPLHSIPHSTVLHYPTTNCTWWPL